jgi:hypothetical protein
VMPNGSQPFFAWAPGGSAYILFLSCYLYQKNEFSDVYKWNWLACNFLQNGYASRCRFSNWHFQSLCCYPVYVFSSLTSWILEKAMNCNGILFVTDHYNNGQQLSGQVDNSGFRLYLTENLRPNLAGMLISTCH